MKHQEYTKKEKLKKEQYQEEYRRKRRWKENTVNQVSSEEVRDETSEVVEGREGGKRTKSVSSEEVDETSGGVEGREGGKKTWSAKSVSLEVEGVEET